MSLFPGATREAYFRILHTRTSYLLPNYLLETVVSQLLLPEVVHVFISVVRHMAVPQLT